MKRIATITACLLAASLTLSGCAAGGAPSGQATADQTAADQTAASQATGSYANGTPWMDCDIDGNVTAETPADAKDNYALYANKDALLALEITDETPVAGTMSDLVSQQMEDVKQMFLGDRPQSHDAQLAYDLFWLMKDWDGRNALGVEPLKAQIDVLERVSSVDELTDYLTNTPIEERLGLLWTSGSQVDPIDSSRHVLSMSNMKLLLMDAAEYANPTDFGAMMKDAYTTLATKVLVKAGYSEQEAAQKVENCFKFETMVAPSITPVEQKQNPDYLARAEKHYTRDEIEAMQQSLPVLTELEQSQGYPESDSYLVLEPDFFAKLNEVYTDDNLGLMKDYLIVQGTIGMSESLDRECYEWFTQATGGLSGMTEIPDDDTVFADKMGMLNWAVGRLYTETYLTQEDKDRVSALVDEVIDAYHGIIAEADFLSEETRAKATEKLDAIDKRIFYPEDWGKYSYDGLDFASKDEGGTFWDASKAVDKYQREKSVEEFSKPVDKEEWASSPQIDNCAYDPLTNSMYIMGAFARGDVYNTNMSDEELYGKLGVVIGHEISHAFDSKGSQFDKDGNMSDWWTEEDLAVFEQKNEKLAAYFDAIHPWEGQDLHGDAMTGEACADMGGLKCMLKIAATKPDFDYDAFFRAFADMWLNKENALAAEESISDVHPLPYLRINTTLQQYDEFLDFYGIKEGDAMYLAPENRVAIW